MKNDILNNKKFATFCILFSLLSLYINILLSMTYNVKEFNRPFLYVYGTAICFCVFFMSIFLNPYKINDIRNLFVLGLFLGMSLASIAMCFNYIFKRPVILPYELIEVSQGKNAVVYKILTDTGEQIPLTIATNNWYLLESTGKIFLYKGALGFYFGDIDSLKKEKSSHKNMG